MPKETESKKKRRGRPGFLAEPATTSISIERKLLRRVTKTAYGLGQSVSQWVSLAAKEKLTRES